MTTLDQVRLGLAARLGTIAGLRVYDMVPADINPPAAFVGAPTIEEYRGNQSDGLLKATFEIGIAVSTGDISQQLQLFPMLERTGAESVFAALEADRTLGGLNVDAFALSARPFGIQEIGTTKYYVASISVRALIG
jgi:hypothetical protein